MLESTRAYLLSAAEGSDRSQASTDAGGSDLSRWLGAFVGGSAVDVGQ